MSSKKLPLYYTLPIILLSSLLVAGIINAVWNEPSVSPPDGNVPAPINVSSNYQIKGSPTGSTGSTGASSLLHLYNPSADYILTLQRGGSIPTHFKLGTDSALVINNSGWNTLTLKNGNIGIGTTRPAVSGLHIGSGVDGGQAQLRLDNFNGNYGMLNRWTNRLEIMANDAIGFAVGAINNNKMWITSSGNVGIGTTNPGFGVAMSGGLTINGTGYTQFTIQKNGSPGLAINVGEFSAGDVNFYDRVGGPWNRAITLRGGNVGIGTTGPGYKLDVAGTVRAYAFIYGSDASLKTNLTSIDNALQKVMGLDGIIYTWKDTGEPGIGFIAQDVEKIFPQLVYTDPQSGLKSLDYGRLTAPIVEALKELKIEKDKEIQELRERNKELEERVRILESVLNIGSQ